ncbi:MAG: replicative DNA helicase [Bacillota bacterium]
MLDRMPPQNIEAEQAVLGAMLIERDAINKVVEKIKETDFYREDHKLLFRTMVNLFSKGNAVDIVTIVDDLRREGKLDAAGGIAYIGMLNGIVPTAANVKYHADIVEEKSLLRSLIYTATNIAAMGYEASEEVRSIVDRAEKMMLEVSNRRGGEGFVPIKEIVFSALERIEYLQTNPGKMTGVVTGFHELDRVTNGMQPSDLILIAARPSMGKTAFVLNICANAAIRSKSPIAFFSLEMSKEQLVQRMICSESAIDSQKLRAGSLDDRDWKKLMIGSNSISGAPIFIDETPSITVLELRSKARRLKSEHNLQMIIIDYLQLMSGGGGSKEDNRQQEISEISRSLKALARELKVPVLALSQLSRGVEARQNKRPMLSDLRESGSLEQDADIVMFLYRDEYYEREAEQPNNEAEVIIAKNRNGPTETLKLFFHKQFTRFDNLSTRQE